MSKLNSSYWNQQYIQQRTGWDMGYASPPIVEYFSQIEDKSLKILIPGAGKAWEAEFLWKQGFENVFVLDFSEQAIKVFKSRVPDFPTSQFIVDDFFKHNGQYDILVEQTFFSSIEIEKRPHYVKKAHELLSPKGKLVGLLFNHVFSFAGPPFGGTPDEYHSLFKKHFHFKVFQVAYNSIKPRKSRELFINFIKK